MAATKKSSPEPSHHSSDHVLSTPRQTRHSVDLDTTAASCFNCAYFILTMLLTPLARDASDLGSIKVEVKVEAMIRYNNVIKYKILKKTSSL